MTPPDQTRVDRGRREVMGLAAAFTVAGCLPAAAQETTARYFNRLPWNARENEQAASLLPGPVRMTEHDQAVSPDGALVAAALPYAPSNEIAIFDLVSQRGWILRHPHRRVMVTGPVFAPDGRLAVLATPPPIHFGISEIWLADPRSGETELLLRDVPRLMLKPSFSADMSRALLFMETRRAPPQPGARLEYRQLVAVSLCEIALAANEFRQISNRAFGRGAAFYAGEGPGYLLSTPHPLIPRRTLPDGSTWWAGPDVIEISGLERDSFGGYFIGANEEIPDVPQGVIPAALLDADGMSGTHAVLEDVDANGNCLVSYLNADAAAVGGTGKNAALLSSGEIISGLALSGQRMEMPRISRDGQTIVAMLGARLERGQTISDRSRPQTFVVKQQREDARFISMSDITFESAPVTLTPPSGAGIV